MRTPRFEVALDRAIALAGIPEACVDQCVPVILNSGVPAA